MIRVEFGGVEDVKKRLDAETSPERVKRIINALATAVLTRAIDRADKHTRTGNMASAIYSRAIAGGREVYIDLQQAPHARYVHFGTRPHEIRPRNRKALRWAAGGGGSTVFAFAKLVRHPGYRGDPFLYRAVEDAMRGFGDIVQRTK